MPLGFQVTDSRLKGLCCCIKTWTMPYSGQYASIFRPFLSGKFLNGGSSLEIIFLFHLSTAPSGEDFLNDQYRRPNTSSPEFQKDGFWGWISTSRGVHLPF